MTTEQKKPDGMDMDQYHASEREDETMLNTFTAGMRYSMQSARQRRGKHGWRLKECSADFLAAKVVENLRKGHLTDAANYLGMLSYRGDQDAIKDHMARLQEHAEPAPVVNNIHVHIPEGHEFERIGDAMRFCPVEVRIDAPKVEIRGAVRIEDAMMSPPFPPASSVADHGHMSDSAENQPTETSAPKNDSIPTFPWHFSAAEQSVIAALANEFRKTIAETFGIPEHMLRSANTDEKIVDDGEWIMLIPITPSEQTEYEHREPGNAAELCTWIPRGFPSPEAEDGRAVRTWRAIHEAIESAVVDHCAPHIANWPKWHGYDALTLPMYDAFIKATESIRGADFETLAEHPKTCEDIRESMRVSLANAMEKANGGDVRTFSDNFPGWPGIIHIVRDALEKILKIGSGEQ